MSRNPFADSANGAFDDLLRPQPHVPTSARLYDEIRQQIISLALPPDATISRNEIAERFNVSQSPVREAMMRLEQDGLIISYPQSRTVVTRIDVARIREEHFLRSSVECEVVRQLAEKRDPSLMVKARGFLKLQEALVGDIEQATMFRQLDEAFHNALFAAVNQTNLHGHISARCGHLARLRTLDLPREEKMESVLDGHRAILEAIETGDGDIAARVMRKHLSGSLERLPRIRADNETLFS
jgi:DNA-binding GntR family transcriptional regulator